MILRDFCWREIGLVAALVALAPLAGCASDDTTGTGAASGDEASSSGTGAGGTGAMGNEGGGGTGGTGGQMGLCPQDCSKIKTPQCLKGVCNDGTYQGTFGECVVVSADSGTACDDGLFCTINDACDEGECIGGPQNTCGMAPPECTEVVCDESTQMCNTAPANEGTACTATMACEVNGVCSNGLCVGEPKDCSFSPLAECNTVACNPATGNCDPTPDPAKNGQTCVITGDNCMTDKTCSAGQCVGGTPKDCSALTVACVLGVCNPNNGNCVTQALMQGDMCAEKTDDCNVGICDNNGVCQGMPVANGTPCNDHNSCTSSDSCAAGQCGGMQVTGCQSYYTEGFEACPAGWTFGGDWECGTPTNVGPATAHSGTGVIATKIASNYSVNQAWATTVATSPPIDLATATNPKLFFWAWIDTEGSSFDGANVKISTDGGVTFALLTTVTPPYTLTVNGEQAWGGHQGTVGWQPIQADLTAFAGQEIILRIAFRSDGSGQYPGVYVDDITIAEPNATPLTITTTSPLPDPFVAQPYSATMAKLGGSSGSVWSIVGGTNNGWLTINPATGALSGTPAVANAGDGTVIVHVEEPAVPSNFDEKTFAFHVAQLLYQQTFEGACPNAWTLGGDWECGVPSAVGPAAAFSGTKCLGTQIDANYNNDQAWTTAVATSPPINLAGLTTPKLSFRTWIDTEGSSFDGFNIKVSTDGGVTYNLVNAVTPAYSLTVSSEAAWGGHLSAQGWQLYTADLAAFAGQNVLVRIAFHSDSSIVYPGVYVDDVTVSY